MTAERSRFRVVAERSAILIEARSSVGPIAFGTTAIEGHLEAIIDGRVLSVDPCPSAGLSIDLASLQSGNSLYDAELRRRIDVRRYPTTSIDMREAERIGDSDTYRVEGAMTFHGVSASIGGAVSISQSPDGNLMVVGEQVIDIRDYDLVAPTVLMLKIYPDVRVQMQLEVEPIPNRSERHVSPAEEQEQWA